MNKKAYENILEVTDLKKSYHVKLHGDEEKVYPVLQGISLQVKPQEFVGIMGRSGCGKTTFLNCLGMMHRQDSGTILYKGIRTNKLYGDTLAEVRRKEIAYIFQDFYLMDSLSVQENIMLPLILNEDDPNESKRRARELAERFEIAHLLDKKPYELSGGEKQRTAICRAMIMNPDLILADEPTGNLDSNSSMRVIKALSQINQNLGITVILVTHDPQIASYCKRIVFLKDGKILEEIYRDGTGEKAKEDFYMQIIHKMKAL